MNVAVAADGPGAASDGSTERTEALCLARWLNEPSRICPVLAAPAIIRGTILRMRLRGEDLSIAAPPRYLARLYDWCNGEKSMAEIGRLAGESKLGKRFLEFLDALTSAGVLVDAAQVFTADAARYPSWMGMAAPEEVWSRAQHHPGQRLPEGSLALPAARLPNLDGLLRLRKSASSFGDTPLQAVQLAMLLSAAYGVVSRGTGVPAGRAVASAGAFYPLAISLVLLKRVGGTDAGLYQVHYAGDGAVGLEPRGATPVDLIRAFTHPHRLSKATGVVVVSADLRRGSLKYRNRIYPYALLEAGAAIHNAALACAEMGLGWRTLGGFDDGLIERICGLADSSALATGVFGSLPPACDAVEPSRAFSFAWSNAFAQAPFHVASVALVGAEDAEGARPSPCWGRDGDPVRAFDKAMGEAVERSAYQERRGDVEACAADIDGLWVRPDDIARFSAAQYRRKDFPLCAFRPRESRRWVRATRVDDGASAWVLADFVYAPVAFDPVYRSKLVFRANSSGCASHGTLEQALDRALVELVERDAFVRHWLTQRPGMWVESATLPGWIGSQITALQAEGCEVWVQMLEPLAAPVWLVIIRSERGGFTCVGTSAGPSAEEALSSAFIEAHTAALARLGGVRPREIAARDVKTPRDHADLHALRRHLHRTDGLLPAQPAISMRQVLSHWPADMADLTRRLRERGIGPAYAVDLSLPDAPQTFCGDRIRTVRALVPGLLPLTFGAGVLPAAMVDAVAGGGWFPHPFP